MTFLLILQDHACIWWFCCVRTECPTWKDGLSDKTNRNSVVHYILMDSRDSFSSKNDGNDYGRIQTLI